MSEESKTYIFKGHKSLCLVRQPMGKRDANNNRIPRVAYHFNPMHVVVGGVIVDAAGFKSADPKIQAWIESQEDFKRGSIVIFKPGMKIPETSPEPKSKAGALEAGDQNPPAAPKASPARPKGARVGKAK
jgi:hypothetical protein